MALAAAGAVLLVAACGGGDDDDSPAANDEADLRQAATVNFEALVDSRDMEAYEQLTAECQDSQSYEQFHANLEVARELWPSLHDGDEWADLVLADVELRNVTRDSGEVRTLYTGENAGAGADAWTEWRLEDGEWRSGGCEELGDG